MPNALRKPVAPAPADLSTDPMKVVRTRADALYRAAVECCRQHDRAARLSSGDADPELEHKHSDAMCAMCDGSLAEIAESYAEAAADVHPEQDDQAWWHKANSLWHSAREYARRHAGCEAVSRKVSAKHSSEQLGSLQMEYELEASALLALRHAAEAYRKMRPQLA
jgi:hypothetical protein